MQTKSKLVGNILRLDQIRIQIVLLGFGMLRLAQQKEREGAGIPGWCSSAAKGLGSACKGAEAERSSLWPAAPFTQLQGRESTRPSFHLAIHYPRSTTGWTSQMSSPFGAFAFSQFQSQLGASPCLLSSKYVLIVQIGITWKTNKLIKVPTYLTLYSNLCVNWKHYLRSMNI